MADQDLSQPADPAARIDAVLGELHRVWKRNPRKSLTQIIRKATSFHVLFDPSDVTDGQLLDGLRQIGPGLPAPE